MSNGRASSCAIVLSTSSALCPVLNHHSVGLLFSLSSMPPDKSGGAGGASVLTSGSAFGAVTTASAATLVGEDFKASSALADFASDFFSGLLTGSGIVSCFGAGAAFSAALTCGERAGLFRDGTGCTARGENSRDTRAAITRMAAIQPIHAIFL